MVRATFAAGCFWGVEEVFRTLDGVLKTAVGYMGGTTENPTYEMVWTGMTDHAEVVEISFDPAVISFQQLLELFWANHDPTTLNRQEVDSGTQYRSAIFYHDDKQCQQAEESKTVAAASFNDPIVTEITPAEPFWRAEEYHQQYFMKQKSGFML
ncbi:MAG: peptide-methionine (S)-S-oxide reductase MsrA [Thermodesulfobacteriota bacterium]|nr:peptide-methionine (S)-S-oxide reductase MsrA [Thermodesulfobacteriota bacterium]